MSNKSEVADRLLTDARKRTAKAENPTLAKAALVVGVIAVLVSWISLAGWVFGATAIGLAAPGARGTTVKRRAMIAIGLGWAALVIATFFFTLNISRR